jgi:hypothetical protein
MNARLVFVIGASAARKTAAVRTLERRERPSVYCYYFDTIGVPSPAEMERQTSQLSIDAVADALQHEVDLLL